MPWNGATIVDLRREFVHFALSPGANVSDLCRRYNIARPTAYKWIKRYSLDGEKGLVDQKREARTKPLKTPIEVEGLILNARKRHPGWGGRKLRKWLLNKNHINIPAASTITEILRRNDLLDETKEEENSWQRFEHEAPNRLWQMDFKGHFAMEKGRCHPLTILDDHSRFSIGLDACGSEQREPVEANLIKVFKRYGLPERINVDNGPPWGCSTAGVRFTGLTVWLISLGIQVSFSRPLHPQTNGKLERFHRSLKRELLGHSYMRDLLHAQQLFDKWRTVYNQERPHEAIGMAVPADLYRPSYRQYKQGAAACEYDNGDVIRKVAYRGYIRYNGDIHYIGEGFRGKDIAIRQTTVDGVVDVYFCHQKIKQIDLRNLNR